MNELLLMTGAFSRMNFFMKLRFYTIVGLLVSLICSAFGAGFRAEGATVHINEMSVFTLKIPLNGKTPSQRAEAIVNSISTGELRLPLRITISGKDLWLKSGEMSIVRVTPAEAKANGTSSEKLMAEWKSKVEIAMNLPPIVFPVERFSVVENSSGLVRIIGNEALLITPKSSRKDIFEVEIASGGIKIKGIKPGQGVLEVESPSGIFTFPIEITAKPTLSQSRFSTSVSGTPATIEMVDRAVRDIVSESLVTTAGTSVSFLSINSSAIMQKESKEIKAKIRLLAPGYAPYDFDIVILVKNVGYKIPKEKEFWYSNKPETFRQSGTLFNSSLKMGTPVRMLYHHRNGTNAASILRVIAYNTSPVPAKIAVLMGDGQPDQDPVKTGTDAGEMYFRNMLAGTYEIIEIPAMCKVPLSARNLEENQCMSGLITMNLMEGSADGLVIRAESLPTINQTVNWDNKVDAATSTRKYVPKRIEQMPNPMPPSLYVYQSPYRDLNVEYTAGSKKSGVVRVGQTPIASIEGTDLLEGNYGVTYNVVAKLENSLSIAQNVQVAFEASAGYLGCVFIIEGEIVRPTILQTKEERIIATVKLAPNQRKSYSILTMPLGGSSYPATMTFRQEGVKQTQTKPPRIGETR